MPVENLPETVEMSLDEVQAHFRKAKALQSEGRFVEAASEWVAGLQLDPRDESAHLSLADALIELKLFQPASIACRQALMVASKSAGAFDRLGQATEALGDRQQAIEYYMQSLRLQ